MNTVKQHQVDAQLAAASRPIVFWDKDPVVRPVCVVKPTPREKWTPIRSARNEVSSSSSSAVVAAPAPQAPESSGREPVLDFLAIRDTLSMSAWLARARANGNRTMIDPSAAPANEPMDVVDGENEEADEQQQRSRRRRHTHQHQHRRHRRSRHNSYEEDEEQQPSSTSSSTETDAEVQLRARSTRLRQYPTEEQYASYLALNPRQDE